MPDSARTLTRRMRLDALRYSPWADALSALLRLAFWLGWLAVGVMLLPLAIPAAVMLGAWCLAAAVRKTWWRW